jgi:hypothetical protein
VTGGDDLRRSGGRSGLIRDHNRRKGGIYWYGEMNIMGRMRRVKRIERIEKDQESIIPQGIKGDLITGHVLID